MALNVEQITSRLAQMPDAALQKYAAMNKNDPYIVALAVSESNRRKQMRQAAQGAQGQMPQPKVVDTAVQSMAAPMPEEQGIARLPAGDMNFADGGIVAFADGGEVERYQFGGSTSAIDRILQKPPYERTPQDNALLAQAGYDVQSRTLGADSGVAGVNTFLQGVGPRLRDYFTGGASRLSSEELAARPAVGGVATERILRSLGAEPSAAPTGPQASYSNEGRREPGMFAAAAPAAPAATTEKPAPKGATASRGAGAPAAPRADTGFGALMKAVEGSAAPADQLNPFVRQMEDLTKSRVEARKKEAEGLEAIQKQFADIYKGKEERLAKREGELGTMKDQSLGLALLQAGAAMMSTPGSLGMAVGKGIDVGSRQYVAGMDKINAAKEKLADARDRLEDLQAQRGEMSARERLKAQSAIDAEQAAGQELLIKANMDMYRISRDEAIKRLDLQTRLGIAQLQEQGQNARAAAANRAPAEIQLIERIAAEKKIPFSQAYQEVAGMKREPVNRAEALKSWTANQVAIQAMNPNIKTFEDYYAQLSGGSGGGGDGFRIVGVR